MEYKSKNPKIFIISGKAGSGKDEIADIIKYLYQDKKCKKLAYAHYLKEYVKDISGWDGSEENKPRDLLQSMGIDLLKKINPNLLINRVCEDIEVYSYFYDVIIVTDARLVEEIEIPKNKFSNIVTIRVNRTVDNKLTDVQRQHITEIGLDTYNNFDYIIENSENYDKLVNDIKNLISEVDSHE